MTPRGHDVVEIVGDMADIEIIATGRGIRRLTHLIECYGGRRWRKLKGVATVRLIGGSTRRGWRPGGALYPESHSDRRQQCQPRDGLAPVKVSRSLP
jgi:hypothetical protein